MKAKRVLLILLVCVLASAVFYGTALAKDHSSRTVDPTVSTDWLEAAIDDELPGLVVIDVRSGDDYSAGHIDGSISLPGFPGTPPAPTQWAVGYPWDPTGTVWMELPEDEDLFDLLGANGITPDSTVVVVGGPGDPVPEYGWAGMTRVATTLIYTGVKNVAVLDGGFPQWVTDGKATTTDVPSVESIEYTGEVLADIFVSTDYVEEHIGRSIILDARDLGVYLGEIDELWTQGKFGHIPTARSLPAPLIWQTDGTYRYRPTAVLDWLATDVIGPGKGKEIIVYCGVGGYASAWWYVLTQVLGYKDVKFYDGSAQEWGLENKPFDEWIP